MMNKPYHDKMKERLSDVVFEYLSDKESLPLFLSDLNEIVKSNYDYFKTYADGCKEVLDKLPVYHNDLVEYSKYYYDRDRNRSTSINNASKKDWDDFWEGL